MAASSSFAPFYRAKEGDATFLKERDHNKAWDLLLNCKASKVYVYNYVCQSLIFNKHPKATHLVGTHNPRLAFILDLKSNREVMDENAFFYNNNTNQQQSRNVIPPSTHIVQPCSVAFTTFGEDCIIYPMTAIGSPALAIERDEINRLHDFPHIGRVEIGNDVIIDSLVSIARGSLDNTIIGDHCRIDNHVDIAHNCHIGANTLLTAGTVIGGSVTIGHDCWLGLNCTIKNSIKIANHVIVGQGANVLQSITEEGDIVVGNPAKSIKEKCNLSAENLYMMTGIRPLR